MAIRKIVEIIEEKCNGCGECIPSCAEGAIKIVNGKAKLISDNLCDGLGACLGNCPMDAIRIIEREADEFDEEAVEKHLKMMDKEENNKSEKHVHNGCPGSRSMVINNKNKVDTKVSAGDIEIKIKSQLSQWPVQLKLVPETAPYFNDKELLVTADCVPFAYPNYHLDLLKNKTVVVGCPKLDDNQLYIRKLTNILKLNNVKGVTVAYMEVPCCQGIVMAVEEAIKASNKNIQLNKVKIKITGEKE